MRIDSLGISRDTEQGGMAFVAGVKQSDQIKGTNCKLEYCITLLLQMENNFLFKVSKFVDAPQISQMQIQKRWLD